MKWQTEGEIAIAAHDTDAAALDCAIEHWRQIAEAGVKVLRHSYANKLWDKGPTDCALCLHYVWCNECPQFSCGPGSEYYKLRNIPKAEDALYKWETWQLLARDFYNHLKGLV